MKNYVPQQVEIWYIIPAFRRKLAKLMIKRGLSQKQTAGKLGITEAAVSQYMKDKRANCVVCFDREMNREIEKSADNVMRGNSPIRELQRLCAISRERHATCRVSKKLGLAPKECRECFR